MRIAVRDLLEVLGESERIESYLDDWQLRIRKQTLTVRIDEKELRRFRGCVEALIGFLNYLGGAEIEIGAPERPEPDA